MTMYARNPTLPPLPQQIVDEINALLPPGAVVSFDDIRAGVTGAQNAPDGLIAQYLQQLGYETYMAE